MNDTVIIGISAFAAILAGAFAGAELRERLPKHHLTDETKNLVSVSTAVVATVSALVLGLLISNANTSFTRLGGQVTALSAEILRLDHILRRYGADAEPARNVLLQYAQHKSADLFPDNRADVRLSNPSTYELLQRLEDTRWPVLSRCSSNWSKALGVWSVSHLSRCGRQSKLWRPNRATKMHLSATSRRARGSTAMRWAPALRIAS
jgi:hypothetical protein